MKVAFIGIGIMGQGMVGNLLRSGHEVHIHSRTKAKAESSQAAGAIWHDTVAGCIQGAEAVVTIVGFPADVEEVYFGAEGILACAEPGTVIIDMTTTSPELAIRIWREAAQKGILALDAPVSGGEAGARDGTLAIMAGGDRKAFDRCMPLFEAMGKNIRYAGAAGAGQHTKMANQIAIAGAISGLCEAIAYARSVGLDEESMLNTIASGAAGSAQLNANGMKIVAGDFRPGFFIKHFVKDMSIAREEAQGRGLELPILNTVLGHYRALLEEGLGDEGTQALIKAY